MKATIFISILCICTFSCFAQTAIEVAENTVKVSPSGEEVFYYGFSKGDQLLFSFEEKSGRELKELEIVAMPSSSLFLDYKTKRIENKVLIIPETGIYKFRFVNSNIVSGRVCKFQIQRTPENEATRQFNTTVYTRTVYDTSYYDAPEEYLVRTDTIVNEIVNQIAKVHSSSNLSGNRTTASFTLPSNTIAWSYYIGVDQAGQKAFENATNQFISNSSPIVSNLGSGNPLAALALGLTSYLTQLQAGEDIDYCLVPGQDFNLFLAGKPFRLYKKGKVINDFSRMSPIPGYLSFCFYNDNAITGVSVVVKVTAIQVNKIWNTRQVTKMQVRSRQEMYLKN